MADHAKQFSQPHDGAQTPARKQSRANFPDLWDQLFAQALKIQPPVSQTVVPQTAGSSTSAGQMPSAGLPSAGLQTAINDIPQAESLQGEEKSESLYIQDAEVLAARNSASAMTLLWERVAPLIRGMVDITLNHHRHVRKEDLQQEAWIAFAQSVERYDGRSRGAYWTYLRLSLHTRFRQFAAHDRVIPIPHDTRQQRANWHKITQKTFDARLQAQNLSYPDAETEGWSTITTEGEDNMENVVIEKMDINIMNRKLQCLPRRWRDLLVLSQKYGDADLALLLDEDEKHMVSLRIQIMDMLRAMPIEYYAFRKSEAEYLNDWKSLSESS